VLLAWQVANFAQSARADEPVPAVQNAASTADSAAPPVSLAAFLQPPPLPPASAPAPELPPVNVVAEPQATPNVGPSANEVAGPSILNGTIFTNPTVNGYNAPTSTVGSFLNTSTMQFPGSISTITRDVMSDQKVINMDDLIRDIPSAVKSYGGDGVIRLDQFFVRGYEVTSQNWRKDGFLDPTYQQRDTQNMERLDVLAGPSSVLYGSAQPTGTFNVTTKQAVADQFANAGVMTGSYGLQRYTMDVNTWLNNDKTVLFRLNGTYMLSDSFRTSVFQEREFLAPTVTLLLDDDTTLRWSGEYQHDRFRLDQGIPAINGDPFAVGNNVFTGNPSGDIGDYHSYHSTLTFERQLNDDWTLRVGEMSLWYNTPSSTTLLDGGTTNPATGLLSSPIFGQDTSVANPFMEQNHDILETLGGEFDTGPFKHKAVFGAEQDWFITNHDTFTTSSLADPATFATIGSAYGPINVLSGASSTPLMPNAATTTVPPTGVISQNVFDNPSFRQNRFGFFAQDMIDVTDRLHVTLGGRFDYVSQEYARQDLFYVPGIIPPPGVTAIPMIRTTDTFNQFSPRAGLTYDLVPERMSVYAMYSRSFTPSIGVANFSAPTQLLPEIGNIWEGGIKTRLNDKFLLTTSGYWIEEHNVNVEQFDSTPGALVPIFLTQAGLERSQGVEANLTGNLTQKLSTTSNFGYNDSYLYGVAQSETGVAPPLAQTRVRAVPHWLGNIWLRYNFVQEQKRTIGAALGMRYVGTRLGDYSSPLVLPSYDIWDLGFYCNKNWWSASLLWDNVFNQTYALSSISQYQVMPGTPSNVRLQFTGTF
jgi:iron complex outermembrane receptor protein